MLYYFTDEDFISAKNFAIKTAKFHKDFSIKRNRDINQKIENIRIGKLGEIAFRYLKKDIIIDKNPIDDTKPSIYDFISKDGKTIDIKTIDRSWKKRVYINIDAHEVADIIVVVSIDEDNKVANYVGYLTKKEIGPLLNYDSKNDAFYVELKYFKNTGQW